MTADQTHALADLVWSLRHDLADMEFVGAEFRPTTDDDLDLAATMGQPIKGTIPDERITWMSAFTESGDVHDFVAIVSDDGSLLASFEVQ